MILTRHEIKVLIKEGLLVFEPTLDTFQDQPHAVDLRLGIIFYIPKIWEMTNAGREVLTVDATQNVGDNFEKIEMHPGQFFELAPGESVIASTMEKISLHASDIMGLLFPRSSVNRRGLSVDLTGIVDVHYSGHLMIPIHNKTISQVIRIYPGERICQIVFQKLSQELSEEEGLKHGAMVAQYTGAGAKNLLSGNQNGAMKKDAQTEMDMIRKGEFGKLKKFQY